MYRIALVSRALYPFEAGECVGAYVAAAAEALADGAEVTVLTTDRHEERHAELQAAGDPRLADGVRYVFVPEPGPDEPVDYFNRLHVWSARVYAALKEVYPDGGPDLVEFPDLGGEAAVTVQARQTLDPSLRRTAVAVRAYGSQELRDILNCYVPGSAATRTLYDLERYALRYADHLLWPGGDVLGTYRRFYGGDRLAPETLLLQLAPREAPSEASPDEGPTRLLHLGRLERRNGVLDLLRAVTSLERDDWSLTLLGEDSRTAPFGVSMRDQLELMAAGDDRIVFGSPAVGEQLADAIGRHHAVVVPAVWACWPIAAVRALTQNRPVLATPVGGLLELVKDGVSGWLSSGTDASSLSSAIERVLDQSALAEMVRTEGPRKTLSSLAEVDATREGYASLAESARGRRRPTRSPSRPRASAVVPYFRLERYVGETVASLFDQTHEPLEVIVVNDGSFRREDAVLEELEAAYPITVLTQTNSGLGAARNFGIRQARGRYILPLDADNLASPDFVERCVDVMEEHDEVAYVTAWSRFDYEDTIPEETWAEGYHPLTNDARSLDMINTAGDAAAVIRRSVFDRGYWYSVDAASSYEDWLFYRRLERAGLHGHVIPERLLTYRVRADSMLREIGQPHHDRLVGEMDAYIRAREMEWTPATG